MNRITYNSNDDNPVEGVVSINDKVEPIPSGSTVKAYVQDIGRTVKIIPDITINENDEGNDWATGKIKGVFPRVSSAALAVYDGKKVIVCVSVVILGHQETFTKTVHAIKLL